MKELNKKIKILEKILEASSIEALNKDCIDYKYGAALAIIANHCDIDEVIRIHSVKNNKH